MTEAEIHDLVESSTAYAVRMIASKSWRGGKGGILPGGRSLQDLVQAAFENILGGGKWDADKPLWMVLQGFIRGCVSNLAVSWENRSFSNPDASPSPDGEEAWVSAIEQFPSSEEGADSRIVRKEDDDLILEIIESLEAGSTDRCIVEALFFGASKRVEVLAKTGMTDKDYEAAKKRLQRFLKEYRQERATVHQ